jgi:hypothetical protein
MDIAELGYDPETVAAVGGALTRMSATETAAIKVPADEGSRLLVATDRGLVDVAIVVTRRPLAVGVDLPQYRYTFSLVRWSLVAVTVHGRTSRPVAEIPEWTLRLSLPAGDLEINAREPDRPWDEFLKAVLERTEGNR